MWLITQSIINEIIQEGMGVDYEVYGPGTLAYEPGGLLLDMLSNGVRAYRSGPERGAPIVDSLLADALPGYYHVIKGRNITEAFLRVQHTPTGRNYKIPTDRGLAELIAFKYKQSQDPAYAQIYNRQEDYLNEAHRSYRNAAVIDLVHYILFDTHKPSYDKDVADMMIDVIEAQRKHGLEHPVTRHKQHKLDNAIQRLPREAPTGLLPPEQQGLPKRIQTDVRNEVISRYHLPENRRTFMQEMVPGGK